MKPEPHLGGHRGPVEKTFNTSAVFVCVEDKVLVRCGDANGRLILRDLRNICSSSSVGRLSRSDKFGLAGGSSAILGDSMRGDLRLILKKDTNCPVS